MSTTGSGRLSSFTFSIHGSGLNANSFAEASTNTAAEGNAFFAAHITGFSAASATSGYFGGSKPASVVPLPGALPLFGAGLLVLFRLLRRGTGGERTWTGQAVPA